MCNEIIIDVTCFKALVTSYTTNQSKQGIFTSQFLSINDLLKPKVPGIVLIELHLVRKNKEK
jgi:hypothetical protein